MTVVFLTLAVLAQGWGGYYSVVFERGMLCHVSSSASRDAFADSEVHLLEYGTLFHLL